MTNFFLLDTGPVKIIDSVKQVQILSFKIIIIDAQVTLEFTDAIGADGYGENHPRAVEQVNRFVLTEEKVA